VTEYRVAFLYEAIKDAQGTIRAIDFKANALLVTMALIITNIQHFVDAVHHIGARSDALPLLAVLLAGVAVVMWLTAVTSAFLALRGRSDAGKKLQADGATGAFWDGPDGAVSVTQRMNAIPTTEECAARELAFEHLKLASIRRAKTACTNLAFETGFITLVILMVLWVLSAATA
jgi:hypothetical protein